MECRYLEKRDKRLYSVYNEPKSLNNYNNIGVVLCYPLGQEYIRCYRLFVNLADNLSKLGMHVLRFDYSGTGNSLGDFSSVSINSCLDDLSLVNKQIKKIYGVSKILLIGVRFGATLSLLYSKENYIDGLVLWSPIISGVKYLNKMNHDYKVWLSGTFAKEKKIKKNSVEIFGFALSSYLIKEIRSVVLSKEDFISDKQILFIDKKNLIDIENITNVKFQNSINNDFWVKRENEVNTSMIPNNEFNLIISWVRSNFMI